MTSCKKNETGRTESWTWEGLISELKKQISLIPKRQNYRESMITNTSAPLKIYQESEKRSYKGLSPLYRREITNICKNRSILTTLDKKM